MTVFGYILSDWEIFAYGFGFGAILQLVWSHPWR